MRITKLAFAGLAATAFSAAAFGFEAEVDAPAPDFTAVDSKGVEHSLSDFAGKTVVLEWTNHGCPYVQKHYKSGNMQAMQKETTSEDVVWLSIISSAPGEQGHVTGAEADALTASRGAAPTAVLLDPTGEVGRLYDAKTTPHMYVIDGEGTLRYAGAIDSIRSTDVADVEKAENYVLAALADIEAGREVATKRTTAYGCSVKYAS